MYKNRPAGEKNIGIGDFSQNRCIKTDLPEKKHRNWRFFSKSMYKNRSAREKNNGI
jgi:hypothetical protein